MKKAFLPLLLSAGFILSLILQASATGLGLSLDPIQIFENPEPEFDDAFGSSVALGKDVLVIGAPFDRAQGIRTGRAHVYHRQSGQLLHTLEPMSAQTTEHFGLSALIDGNHIVIGAPNAIVEGVDAGRVYVYDSLSAELISEIDNPSPTLGGDFGRGIASDNGRLFIGAFGHDTAFGNDVGRAYLLTSVQNEVLFPFDNPAPQASDAFGFSVSLSGSYALIGAPLDNANGLNTGQAYLIDVTTGQLVKTFNNPNANVGAGFGRSVALGDGFAVIGANLDDTDGVDRGGVFLFSTTTGDLLLTLNDPTPSGVGQFGFPLALDGRFLLVSARAGDRGSTNAGEVYLFDALTGQLLHVFENPSPDPGDFFGESLAISGSNVLIGASGDNTTLSSAGRAYLYDISEIRSAIDVPLPPSLGFLFFGFVLFRQVQFRSRL